MILAVTVHGTPAPQGSKKHVGRGVMVESSEHLPPWRAAITDAALRAAIQADWAPNPHQPVTVWVTFTLPRPAHHLSKRNGDVLPSAPTWPAVRPDLDKLIRSVLDGLTDAGVIADDARVTEIGATKTYPGMHPDALDTPGALILMEQI